MEEPVKSVVNIGELSTFLMCLEVPGPVVSGTVVPVVIRVCVCMHIYVYTMVHTFQNMLKSEHNISECVISFYHVGNTA